MTNCCCAVSLLTLSILLCIVLRGVQSSSVLRATVENAADNARYGGESSRSGGLYFSLKRRDSPDSPFRQRHRSRMDQLQVVLHRDNARAKSFQEHIITRQPRRATGMSTEKDSSDAAPCHRSDSPADPTVPENLEQGSLLAPENAGEYYTELYAGTPRQLIVAMVDLGSDVFWMGKPLSRLRNRKYTDPVKSFFYPSSSVSFTLIPSGSENCLALKGIHVSGQREDCRLLVGTKEQYYGALEFAYEDIRLNKTAEYKSGVIKQLLISVSQVPRSTAGVLGLGRGDSSFATQVVKRHTHFFNRISYRLADTDEPAGSSLVFSSGEGGPHLEFTPLLKHPLVETFYFVNLVAVAVNGAKLPISSKVLKMNSEGNGGAILDMSTRFTRFPKSAFDHLVKALKALIRLPTMVVPRFQLCYSTVNTGTLIIPTVTLIFENGVRMRLPMENTFVSVTEQGDVMCLAMVPGNPGTATVIGSAQQQNFLIVIDREASRLGFAPLQCASSPNL